MTTILEKMLENCKNITYTESKVKILSALDENSEKQLKELADEIL